MSIEPPRPGDRDRAVEPIPPEDTDTPPSKRGSPPTADDVPVPPVMSPAEVDERAKVVERLEDDELTP